MDRTCYFCRADETNIEKHLVTDHNIVFGVDALIVISKLNESEMLELENFLDTLVITFRPQLTQALLDNSDHCKEDREKVNEESLGDLVDIFEQKELTEKSEEVFNTFESISNSMRVLKRNWDRILIFVVSFVTKQS